MHMGACFSGGSLEAPAQQAAVMHALGLAVMLNMQKVNRYHCGSNHCNVLDQRRRHVLLAGVCTHKGIHSRLCHGTEGRHRSYKTGGVMLGSLPHCRYTHQGPRL